MRTTSKTKLTITVVIILLLVAIFLLKSLRSKNTSSLLSNHNLVVAQTETLKKEALPQPPVKPAVTNEAELVKKAESSESKSRTDEIVIGIEDLEALIEPGFYAEPWKRQLEEYEDLINIPIRAIAEPEDYTVKFNPTPNRSYRCFMLITTWVDSLQEPVSRLVSDGSVSIKHDSEGSILVEQELKPPWGLVTGAEMPEMSFQSSKRQFLVRDGALHLIQQTGNGREVEDTPFVGGNIEMFILYLPKGTTPQVDTPWEINREKPFPSKVTHTLVGFAEVNGIRTAKIHSQIELPSKESMVTYVELGTGIVVRTERECTQETSGSKLKFIAVSQTIPVNE